ncbi:hypothetical protein HK104_002387 [Borealophlyctis nickersoniae]|nr:hypothetical protein HK104_002387 [Borealophlyctis nickersoniae]
MAAILASTILCGAVSRRYESQKPAQPMLEGKVRAPLARNSTPKDACRAVTVLSGVAYSTISENSTFTDPGATVKCFPEGCPCLTGVARHHTQRERCRLHRHSDRSLNNTAPGVYYISYWLECGLEKHGRGVITTNEVSRILHVRKAPTMELVDVRDAYREVLVRFGGAVVEQQNGNGAGLGAPPSFVARIVPSSSGKAVNVTIERVDSIGPHIKRNASAAGANRFSIRLSYSGKWNSGDVLEVSPNPLHCFDAAHPFGACADQAVSIRLRAAPSFQSSLLGRRNRGVAAAQFTFSEAVGSRGSYPIRTDSFVAMLTQEKDGKATGEKRLRVVGVKKISGTATRAAGKYIYKVAVALPMSAYSNGDQLKLDVNSTDVFAVNSPRLGVRSNPSIFTLTKGKIYCSQQCHVVGGPKDCAGLGGGFVFSEGSTCPCKANASAVEAPRQDGGVSESANATISLHPLPSILHVYRDSDFEVIEDINEPAQSTIESAEMKHSFDRAFDTSVPGVYVQSYWLESNGTVRSNTLTRVVHVRETGPPMLTLIGHGRRHGEIRVAFSTPVSSTRLSTENSSTQLLADALSVTVMRADGGRINTTTTVEILSIVADSTANDGRATYLLELGLPYAWDNDETIVLTPVPGKCFDKLPPYGACVETGVEVPMGVSAQLVSAGVVENAVIANNMDKDGSVVLEVGFSLPVVARRVVEMGGAANVTEPLSGDDFVIGILEADDARLTVDGVRVDDCGVVGAPVRARYIANAAEDIRLPGPVQAVTTVHRFVLHPPKARPFRNGDWVMLNVRPDAVVDDKTKRLSVPCQRLATQILGIVEVEGVLHDELPADDLQQSGQALRKLALPLLALMKAFAAFSLLVIFLDPAQAIPVPIRAVLVLLAMSVWTFGNLVGL